MSNVFALPEPNNIDYYMTQISKIPLIEAEEEFKLAIDYSENNNLESAKKLVLSHLRYVAYIANQYRGYKLPISDLIQEGNIGLMKAVKKFDPNKGVRLISYATIWIKEKIHDFVIKNLRMGNIATTKSQRKLFFNLSKEKELSSNKWLTKEERLKISKKLNVPQEDVETMESRLYSYDKYLGDTNENQDNQSEIFEIEDEHNLYEDMENNQEAILKSESLKSAIQKLNDREKDIIKSRWLCENTQRLEDLSKKYSVSKERIRQLEKRALEKLKNNIVL